MDSIDYGAIVRVLTGAADAEEVAAVTRWSEESPANREWLDRIVEVWRLELSAPSTDVDAAWNRLSARLSETSGPRLTSRAEARATADARATAEAHATPSLAVGGRRLRSPGRGQSRSSVAPVLRAAAVIACVVTSAAGAWWYASPLVSMRQTASGVREALQLADRSRVVLGPASRLRSSGRFARLRRVELAGSAYFDVVHDSSRPFRVETASSDVEVLGTAFTVDTRGTRIDGAVVAVHRGRVRVESSGAERSEEVGAGGLARVEADGPIDVDYPPDLLEFSSLHTGKLVFRATPVAVVVEELTHWYGVPLRVDSITGRIPVTLEIADEPLPLIADLLAAATASEVRAEADGSLRLVPTPAEHGSPPNTY